MRVLEKTGEHDGALRVDAFDRCRHIFRWALIYLIQKTQVEQEEKTEER